MKSKIKILAIEDEPLHEERLVMILEELNHELIDVLDSPKGVMTIINATKPDLILMDIDLGSDINGIELTKKINQEHNIPTIFLTSHEDDETFQKAKETKPHAYLIKPYKKEELQRSIELSILLEQGKGDKNTISTQVKNHIFIRSENRLVKVDWKEITFVSAYDKYCYIHIKNQKIMVKERLKNIYALLPQNTFIQVHRSFVINIDAITSFNNDMSELYIGEEKIKVGRLYKQQLISEINTIG
ncbi:response regulator [Gaetbulibacter sp. M235]|uniref:LytR/AlgR family response regulator transcription factor n=1 Tax=Gaetbulibacter sp. M235 TaxID=3126510 RepID=UPI00374E4033